MMEIPPIIYALACGVIIPIVLLLQQARDIKKKTREQFGLTQKQVPVAKYQGMLTCYVIETMHKFHPKCDPKADLKGWREYVANTADTFVEVRNKMLAIMREEDPSFEEEDVLKPGTGAAIVMDQTLTPEQKKAAEVRNWQLHGDTFRMNVASVEPFMFRHGYPTLEQSGLERKEYVQNVSRAFDILERTIPETFIRHWPPQCPVEVMEAMRRPREIHLDDGE